MAQSGQKGRSILNTLLVVMIGQVGCLTLVIILASVFGGLWLDSLSANPLGVSVLPLFVIGGINAQTLPSAVAAGARRIAVSAAVCQAEEPRQVVAELESLLKV